VFCAYNLKHGFRGEKIKKKRKADFSNSKGARKWI